MAVPDYQTLMLPLLRSLQGGEVRRLFPEVGDQIAGEFGLTEEDLEQMLPSGTTTTYRNRLHWAATYMVKAGLMTRPERGKLRITERGEDVLAQQPAGIDNTYLSRFPEFVAFRAKRNAPTVKPAPDDEENPEESLYSAYGSWRATIEADLLTSLQSDAFHWADFERLVVDLLHAMGYGRGDEDRKRVTKMTGDHGIDGVIDEDRLGLDAVYIQAKNYSAGNNVGRPDLQKFTGSLEEHHASKGVFITTSGFSKDALEYVERIPKRIVLIDGQRLAALMYDYGIGVRNKRSLDVKTVDDAYFEGE